MAFSAYAKQKARTSLSTQLPQETSRRRAHHYLHNCHRKPPTQRPQTPFEGEDAVHTGSAGGPDGQQGVAAAAAGPAASRQ